MQHGSTTPSTKRRLEETKSMPGDFVAIKRLLIKTTSPNFRRGLINTRDRMLDWRARWRNSTGWSGSLPDFIVVGTQKGGTTELYDQLARHPQVMPAFAKEVHFFDANWDKGTDWYAAFFPQRENKSVAKQALAEAVYAYATGNEAGNGNGTSNGNVQSNGHTAGISLGEDNPYPTGNGMITGEASPCYMFHPQVAQRARATIPHAKVIIMLRNPVDRAYSQYHHEVRLGFETLPFAEAIAREDERLAGEWEKMQSSDALYRHNYMHYSYLHRGIYLDQVKAWYDVFPADQILLLQSEAFFGQTEAMMQQVYNFLGIAPIEYVKAEKHKSFPYPKMDKSLRQQLTEYFAPHNQALYAYLGRDFSW